MLHAVIMAGGSGTRFWPGNGAGSPKQLLDLVGRESMIEATVRRLGSCVPMSRVLIVTNRRLVEPIRALIPKLPENAVIGEPCKRDTAPCIGLAAALVLRNDPDAIMAVMPSDHVIGTDEVFQKAISEAARLVQDDPSRIVTFGIRPTYPAESFGYIERGVPLTSDADSTFRVLRFREKPNAAAAKEFLDSGSFYWNSGIFVWSATTILQQLRQHEPEMFGHLEVIQQSMGSPQFLEVLDREFTAIQGKSIDFAVMEHARNVLVMEAPFAWDDVGSWQSLSRLRPADGQGNTVIGRFLGVDTRGSIIRTSQDHLVVTLGMEDCIVVHTEDATLVASKHHEESVRNVVKILEERGWEEHL